LFFFAAAISTKGYPLAMAGLPEHLAKGPVGREPLSREVIEGHQRERIAGAAVDVFAKRGYRATTIDHIVAAAQVGVGSFYSLFEGKEECFLYIYGTMVSEVRERLAAAIPDGADWVDAVGAVLCELLDTVTSDPFGARIVFVEAQTAGAAAEARYAETMSEPVRLLRGGRALRQRGEELPAGLESATVAGIAWLIHQRLVAGRPQEIPALLPEVAEIVFEPYLGRAETELVMARLLPAATA